MLLNLRNGYFKIYDQYILKNVNLQINHNEKICLIGKNGIGKSTLLKIIYEKIELDKGIIEKKKKIKVNYLQQTLPKRSLKTIYHFIYKKIEKKSNFLLQYENIIKNKKNTKKNLYYRKLLNLQELIKKNNLWDQYIKINKLLQELSLNKYSQLSSLSGGNLQKVSIIITLSYQSHLLLLDEPTNHLDTNSIIWLEKYIKNFSGSILFVSHDRKFINNVSTNIIDLDNHIITNWKVKKYEDFMQKKNTVINIEKIHNKKFQIEFKKEEKKTKKGIKARGKKNIKQLNKFKKMQLTLQEINKKKINNEKYPIITNLIYTSNKIMINIKNVNLILDNKNLIKNFSNKIFYGEKIALIGSNGCGKSSMLKILFKQLKPTAGYIKYGKKIKVEYLDQECTTIQENNTVLENLLYIKDNITILNKTYTIIGILKKFLFSKEKIYAPAKSLSGGEKSRLLLLRLLLQPSNILILDEPTNNLDLTMLSFLEKFLLNYNGTIIFASHDRFFINKISNKFWFFNQNNIDVHIGNFFKIYNIIYKKNLLKKEKKIKNLSTLKKKSMNFILKKELKNIPNEIEKLEKKIKKINNKINNSNFYKNNSNYIKSTFKKLNKKDNELKNKFMRWEYLEKLKMNI